MVRRSAVSSSLPATLARSSTNRSRTGSSRPAKRIGPGRRPVLDYTQFLSEVQKDGSFGSREEAEALVVGVLMAMAGGLPPAQPDALASPLPAGDADFH